MNTNWFAVKTLYRTITEGDPEVTDDDYSDQHDLIEERIVLFQATDFEAALDAGVAEAQKYSESYQAENIYGQKLILEYTGACEAFRLPQSPNIGAEVFSNTFVINKSITDEDVANRFLGEIIPEDEYIRKNFCETYE